jgi:hypothetical protein
MEPSALRIGLLLTGGKSVRADSRGSRLRNSPKMSDVIMMDGETVAAALASAHSIRYPHPRFEEPALETWRWLE